MIPDDVKRLAVPVLAHRIVLRPESELRGRTGEKVVDEILSQVPIKLEEDEPAPVEPV